MHPRARGKRRRPSSTMPAWRITSTLALARSDLGPHGRRNRLSNFLLWQSAYSDSTVLNALARFRRCPTSMSHPSYQRASVALARAGGGLQSRSLMRPSRRAAASPIAALEHGVRIATAAC